MKVLLLGSGGRESAMAWALARSPLVESLFAAPGNPGIAALAETFALDPAIPDGVVDAARRTRVDLVVVGPEAPLVAGVADALRAEGIDVFGPAAAAARIEGSKAYAKELMNDAGIPTARAATFDDPAAARAFLDTTGPPYVIKADGLAAGKGVVVTQDREEAEEAIDDRLVRSTFGAAGDSIVIEEFLPGEEASVIAFADGKSIAVCEPAQDYKRVNDGDAGPNTGGMGSYSPVPACPPELVDRITTEVLEPMVDACARRGEPFVGALYAGLALTPDGPKVIEFNARFGDPETQALLPRLESDFAELCAASARGELAGVDLRFTPDACVAVVAASGGYPGDHETGFEISGLDDVAAMDGVEVFHAGTAEEEGRIVTAGGRVLAVSARGASFAQAQQRAYDGIAKIKFEGMHARTDIAQRAVITGRG